MPSNIQCSIEKARSVYEVEGQPTLLSRICKVHGITVRDFAAIFGISKTYAAEIIAHRKMPDLELGIRISRYWECSIEELFGWRVDDDGKRRPLLIIDPSTGQVRKLVGKDKAGAVELAKAGCGDGE